MKWQLGAQMKYGVGTIFLLLLMSNSPAFAADEFSVIRCNSDIPKSLLGRAGFNGVAADVEHLHTDLGLKDMGADGISDKIIEISWMICGKEFMLLEDDRAVVRDVLQLPPHSKSAPEFIGTCTRNGTKISDAVVAILELRDEAESLPAKTAWEIDEKNVKFIKLSTEGLACPHSGIITADGGL